MTSSKNKKTYSEFVNAEELNLLAENYEKFNLKFKRYYRTGQKLTFREWLNKVGELLDDLI